MTDVLIVCVRDDEVQAKALADLFEREGMSVGGAPADDAALKACGAVVVLWSQASIRSRPFLDAAQRVVNAGKGIVACLIDAPPASSLNQSPCIDLRSWDGTPDDPIVDPLYFAVDRMVNTRRAAAPPAAPLAPQPAAFAPPAAPPPYGRAVRAEPPRPESARPEPTRYEPPAYEPPAYQAPDLGPRMRRAQPLAAAPAADPHDPMSAEALRWRAIRHSRDPASFLHYLAEYGPEGAFSELAELRLKQLQDANATPLKAAARAVARGEPQAAPRRAEPLQPKRSEPPPVRVEPQPQPHRIELAPREDEFFERPFIDNSRAREKRGGGGAVRFLVLFLLLGGGALAAGMYFGNGQQFGGATPEQPAYAAQEQPATDITEPMAAVQEASAAIGNAPAIDARRAVGGPTLQEESSFSQPERITPSPTRAAAPAEPRQPRFEPSSSGESAPVSLMPEPVRPAPMQMAAASEPARPAIRQGVVSWRSRANGDQLSAVYPALARRAGVEGRVRLSCTVRPDLSADCAVTSETPTGRGFGAAALRVARNYRASPLLSDGAPAEGARADLNIVFRPN